MHHIYLVIAIISEVIATNALNASEGYTKLVPSIISFVGYTVSFYLLSLALNTIPVGVAYAIWSGVGIVLTALVAAFLFNQTLDLPAIIGMGLIIAGVLVMNLFSNMATH